MTASQKVPPSALEYAMAILAKRVYAESEIVAKLRRKNYSAAEIASAVEDCKRYSFINDENYARDYACLLNSRGCGRLLIRRKLQMLRIPEEYIENALQIISGDELEAARRAFDFKCRMLKNEKDKYKKKQKLYAFIIQYYPSYCNKLD